jgi:hypothetical protein
MRQCTFTKLETEAWPFLQLQSESVQHLRWTSPGQFLLAAQAYGFEPSISIPTWANRCVLIQITSCQLAQDAADMTFDGRDSLNHLADHTILQCLLEFQSKPRVCVCTYQVMYNILQTLVRVLQQWVESSPRGVHATVRFHQRALTLENRVVIDET